MAWLIVHETGMLEDRFGPEVSPGQRILAQELPAASTVSWSSVDELELPQVTWATGALTASHVLGIAPEVSGRIVSLDLEVGQAVKVGEVLFRMDARSYQTAVNQASANLSVLTANVNAAEAGVDVAKSGVKAAEVALEFAQVEADRQAELFAKKATTDQALTAAKSTLAGAKANLSQVRAHVLVAQAEVAAARSQLAPAEQQLGLQQLALERTEVLSPIAGVVTARSQVQGSLGVPGQIVVTLRAPGDLRVSAHFDEGQALELGDELFWELPGVGLSGLGQVIELASSVDSRTRTREVHVLLKAADAANLKPGQFARLGLVVDSTPSLVIPASAVHRRGQVQSVSIRRGDKIVKQHVRTVPLSPGELTGSGTEVDLVRVLSGLTAADEVRVPEDGGPR